MQREFFFGTISGALESLGQLMGAADTPLFAAEEAKKALIGLARDLRGLAYAFNTKTSYMMLFDWMYVCVRYTFNILMSVSNKVINFHSNSLEFFFFN